MQSILRIEKQQLAKGILIVLGAAWILGAAWTVFLHTEPTTNTYSSYERQLAKCRTQPTSQTRYDCTSNIMLAKDNSIFNKTLTIFVPPLWLFGAYWVVNRMIKTRQEEAKSRAAMAASRKRMAEWHKFLTDIRAGQTTQKPAGVAGHGRPIATPSHLAKKR